MSKALDVVEKGIATLRKASILYNVPKSTLHYRVSGRVAFNAQPGSTPYLTLSEEEDLASFLFRSAKIGYPHTRKKVLYLVQQITNNKGISGCVTNEWWECFKHHHTSVVQRSAIPLSTARGLSSNKEVIDRYFDLLEDILKANGILLSQTAYSIAMKLVSVVCHYAQRPRRLLHLEELVPAVLSVFPNLKLLF